MNKEVSKTENNAAPTWTSCTACKGRGTKSRRIRKKARLGYERACAQYEKKKEGPVPVRPRGHQYTCTSCNGAGILPAQEPPLADTIHLPQVAIIGGGIGGVALAVACLHRGIPFTLFERDLSFNARSQGYGLTLQQASKAIEGFGITSLKEGVISTRHLVHTPEGKVVGEWGMRKWLESNASSTPKRTNIHIARQALRSALLAQLEGHQAIQWGHQLIGFETDTNQTVHLKFQVAGTIKKTQADLIVGADGIRSKVRQVLIGEEVTPLRYLDCIAILGICPLEALHPLESPLLDAATVFQTANGNERIYIMPYSSDQVMWQLSYPMTEKEARRLSAQGPKALKEEAIRRTQWHSPIPEIIASTQEAQITGYPVYDRALLQAGQLAQGGPATLLGDAAHPMSPFKGQGANQALLDALSLARTISIGCRPQSQWLDKGIRKSVLTDFEAEMLARSALKVKASAQAAAFLHSDAVLHQSDAPRGRHLEGSEED